MGDEGLSNGTGQPILACDPDGAELGVAGDLFPALSL